MFYDIEIVWPHLLQIDNLIFEKSEVVDLLEPEKAVDQ